MKLLLANRSFERTLRGRNDLTKAETDSLIFAIKVFLGQSDESKPPIMLNSDFRRLAEKVECLHLDSQALEMSLCERTLVVNKQLQMLRMGLNALA